MESKADQNKQSTMQITGMTCAACANRIEKGLNKVEGVSSANVNFALEKANVTYDPAKVDRKNLEETIKKNLDTAQLRKLRSLTSKA